MAMNESMNAIKLDEIFQIYTEVMKSILLIGESSLPEMRFKAFRRIVLDEFSKARRKIRYGKQGGIQGSNVRGFGRGRPDDRNKMPKGGRF